MPLQLYLGAVGNVAARANEMHGPLANVWHGVGLIQEEVQEFAHWVYEREGERDWDQIHLELVDVGVTSVRLLEFMGVADWRSSLSGELQLYATNGRMADITNLHSALAIMQTILVDLGQFAKQDKHQELIATAGRLATVAAACDTRVVNPHLAQHAFPE